MKKEQLISLFQKVRQSTETLCEPLAIEDYVIQSMEDVSPPKWHLAHTSWYFETFLLSPFKANYSLFNPSFPYLFNSYYQQIGTPFPRAKRGLLSRPTVKEIYDYRKEVNEQVIALLLQAEEERFTSLLPLVTLGIHHEQQHQELLLMDIKHNFSINPLFPRYIEEKKTKSISLSTPTFTEIMGGLVDIGYQGEHFCFDNELPCHKKFLEPYGIANQMVTNSDYLEFITAGGYTKPEWWLADGWDAVNKSNWQAPLYWYRINNEWYQFTLNGLKPLQLNEPVCHVSYYEASAFAAWKGMRLPTEEEWEHYVVENQLRPKIHNFMENEVYHPEDPQPFLGSLWEWTASPYSPYPGYQPAKGALGEYNGKFMANQLVLRGGSCITPSSHLRPTYRNFFQPEKRWQFSGIRLAYNLNKRGNHVC